MPNKPNRPCSKPGCHTLTQGQYCEAHRVQVAKDNAKQRAIDQKGLYDHKWRRARALFLRHNPLCVYCEQVGIIKAADVVDHIKPHKRDMDLFWDVKNWQALCTKHHNQKTAKEDSNFAGWNKK